MTVVELINKDLHELPTLRPGDRLIRQMLRQMAGLEPSTIPGRSCSRCGKDMSHYAVLGEIKREEYCEECRMIRCRERVMEAWENAKAPEYDIDQILGGDRKEILSAISSKIDPWCPEKLLLEPEIVARDYGDYSQFEGYSMGDFIRLGDGDEYLLRGARALRILGLTRISDCMDECAEFLKSQGIDIPEPLPDPWMESLVPEELHQDFFEDFERIDEKHCPYEGICGGDTENILIEYLYANVKLLRQRKPR